MPQGRGPSVSTMRSRRRWGGGSRGAHGRGRSSRAAITPPSSEAAPASSSSCGSADNDERRGSGTRREVRPLAGGECHLARLLADQAARRDDVDPRRPRLPQREACTRRGVVDAYVVAPRGERAHPPAAVGQRRGARRPDLRDQVATVGDDRGADEVRLDGTGPRGVLGAGSRPDERAARTVAEVEK